MITVDVDAVTRAVLNDDHRDGIVGRTDRARMAPVAAERRHARIHSEQYDDRPRQPAYDGVLHELP